MTKKKNLSSNIKNCITANLNNIFKELYKRFFIPFYIPLLILISLLLTTSSKENKNYSKIKIVTFTLGLFFIIFSETTIKLISNEISKNFIISFLPLVFILTLYLIFFKKNNFKSTNK